MSNVSAFVLQMARAHYGGDDRAFSYAALALARHAKSANLRADIQAIVKRGIQNVGNRPSPAASPRSLAPVLTPTASSLYALPEVSFPELLLDDQIQADLDEIVVELEYTKELRERGLRARNRLLFYGPPGNGKTSTAAALANALGARAYCISIPDLVSKYVGETAQNVAKIFSELRDGMVVVFDEIDAVGHERSSDDSSSGKERNSVINAMLQLLDRHKSGVIVGTTNRPDILDPALRRRFDEQMLFPAPSPEQMQRLAEKLCDKFRIEASSVYVDDCGNFDEVTKRVTTEARRQVMAELLAADEDTEQGEANGSQEDEENDEEAAE